MQEEVLDAARKEFRRGEYTPNNRSGLRIAMPLPPPPGKWAFRASSRSDDRRVTEGVRAIPVDDKLGAVYAYRRAKGLCYTCGERWSWEHKYAAMVQLHVVEELRGMMGDSD